MSKKKGRKVKAAASETNKNTKVVQTPSAKTLEPAKAKSRLKLLNDSTELIFGRQNYILMMVGVGLIILGLLLMTGGRNVDPNVFDDSVIYSFRRVTLAPILILAGLIVEVFAIFK